MKRYKAYKDSGVKWIGEIPGHWEVSRLKNHVLLITTPSSSSLKIGLENIEGFTGKFIETETEYDGNGIEVEINDLVYGKLRPYLCKAWLATFPCNAIGDFYVLRCKSNSLSISYLHKLFLSQQVTGICNASTYGAKMPRVSSSFIMCLPMPIPPLREQQAIVDYLKDKTLKIEQYVSARERERELLNSLKQSEIANVVTKGLNPNVKMKDSGIPWIGEIPEHWEVKKIRSCFKERREKVSDKEFSALSVSKLGVTPQLETAVKTDNGDNRKKVCKGDFVVNSRSDRKGSCGYSEYDGSVSLINIVLTPRNIDVRFYHYLFRSNNYIEEFYRQGRGIVADLWTTRYSEMKSIYIPVPPLSEQQAIVAYIDEKLQKIDQYICNLQREIDYLKEFKQRLISDAVTGQLCVTKQ